LGKRRVVEKVNGGHNSTNLLKKPRKKGIHIHGGMEHNLAEYTKYYSCGNKEISRSNEFTREIDHNTRDFFGHWLIDATNKLYFEFMIVA